MHKWGKEKGVKWFWRFIREVSPHKGGMKLFYIWLNYSNELSRKRGVKCLRRLAVFAVMDKVIFIIDLCLS